MPDKSKGQSPKDADKLKKVTKENAAKGGANGGKKGGASSHGSGKLGRASRQG